MVFDSPSLSVPGAETDDQGFDIASILIYTLDLPLPDACFPVRDAVDLVDCALSAGITYTRDHMAIRSYISNITCCYNEFTDWNAGQRKRYTLVW